MPVRSRKGSLSSLPSFDTIRIVPPLDDEDAPGAVVGDGHAGRIVEPVSHLDESQFLSPGDRPAGTSHLGRRFRNLLGYGGHALSIVAASAASQFVFISLLPNTALERDRPLTAARILGRLPLRRRKPAFEKPDTGAHQSMTDGAYDVTVIAGRARDRIFYFRYVIFYFVTSPADRGAAAPSRTRDRGSTACRPSPPPDLRREDEPPS